MGTYINLNHLDLSSIKLTRLTRFLNRTPSNWTKINFAHTHWLSYRLQRAFDGISRTNSIRIYADIMHAFVLSALFWWSKVARMALVEPLVIFAVCDRMHTMLTQCAYIHSMYAHNAHWHFVGVASPVTHPRARPLNMYIYIVCCACNSGRTIFGSDVVECSTRSVCKAGGGCRNWRIGVDWIRRQCCSECAHNTRATAPWCSCVCVYVSWKRDAPPQYNIISLKVHDAYTTMLTYAGWHATHTFDLKIWFVNGACVARVVWQTLVGTIGVAECENVLRLETLLSNCSRNTLCC